MLGCAIRIAERMGIHNESVNLKHLALEGEMRRRLWWSIVNFDSRTSEMSDYRTTTLVPGWDCKPPLNVNDADIRPEMKTMPPVHASPTEAFYVMVRSELCDFVRHSIFHLDFTNPALKLIARATSHSTSTDSDGVASMQKMVESRYLAVCNPENPLHFMTIWSTRVYLAKNRLLEHYSKYSRSPSDQSDSDRNMALTHALYMLECDTKLMTSPLTAGFRWQIEFYFPFPAFIHIVQDLKKRPGSEYAEYAWDIMSDNYEARFKKLDPKDFPAFNIFARMILQAWEARASGLRDLGKPFEPPRMVSDMNQKMIEMAPDHPDSTVEQQDSAMDMNFDDFSIPMPWDTAGDGLVYGMGGAGSAGTLPWPGSDLSGQATTGVDMNQLDWTAIDWNFMHCPGR